MYKILFFCLVTCSINFKVLANMSQINAYQFSFKTATGEDLDLADYQGKVLLVVNTASKCGFTSQYQTLQELYDKYKEQGLVIIGVPSADFGNQEFASENEVKEFADKEFAISFPLTAINKVSGKEAHPFYLWANSEVGFFASPKWNFHKYLIDKNGNIAKWYASTSKPNSKKITEQIEIELAK